jgi:hypothetical protein
MGLAPYGEPKYVDLILDNLLDLKEGLRDLGLTTAPLSEFYSAWCYRVWMRWPERLIMNLQATEWSARNLQTIH